jgi:cytochrome P450
MEGFIHEILRIYPAIPFIPHATYKDTTVRDFYLPANTSVSINSISINNNPKIFVNPKEFNPSRWLDKEGKFKASMVDEIITFGKGKRFCVGKSLARMEVFLMIVKLVQRYKLGVPEGQKIPSCAPVFGPATFVPEEFRLSVTIRQQNE